MEQDYDFEAKLLDITNSMQLVIDELQNGGRRNPEYIEGFGRVIISQVIQVFLAKGFERNEITTIVNDEANA